MDGKNLLIAGRPHTETNEVIRQFIVIDLEESIQTSATNLVLNHGISRRSDMKIL